MDPSLPKFTKPILLSFGVNPLPSSVQTSFMNDPCQEDLSAMGPEEQLRAFSSVVLPEETETPLDIVAKMVIVLINLGAHHLVQVRRSHSSINISSHVTEINI